MVFTLPSFLDNFLDMSLRRNNIIFSPLVQIFSTCDRKTCKKMNGGKKNGIFSPFPYFSPMDHVVFGSPSQTVTVLRCMKIMIFTLGLNVHSSACKFNNFVMNNPDNCSFNHFFFSSILFNCPSLSCHSRLHWSQYAIDNTPLFLGKTNNLMVYNAHKAVIYTYF